MNFLGGRAGIDVRHTGVINVADMPDTDTQYALPGGAAEQVLDFAIIVNENTTTFMANGNVLQVSASTSGGFNGINAIGWGCGVDSGRACSIIDDVRVAETPEPASLGRMALGGIALLRRRRA